MKLLLLSSSKVADTNYLEHAYELVKQHLGSEIKKALFIPYAGVGLGFDTYHQKVEQAFSVIGYEVDSIHNFKDPVNAINQAEAILVGGGNTFCLLNSLYQYGQLEVIQKRVRDGVPYIGWSAGSNIAAPTIKTTNDMPIIEPPSFNALNLINCQVNPHYIDGNPPGHQGETREQRISEFLAVNPDNVVIGIPEGTALVINNNKMTYKGSKQGYQFSKIKGKEALQPEAELSHYLN